MRNWRMRSAPWLAALLVTVGWSSASAETLLMPTRDMAMGTADVVWGVTTQANGTQFVLDYGDGSQTSGNVADRSYIAFPHTYALSNTYTVTLCVGAGAVVPGCPGEQTTTQVRVFNTATLTNAERRGLHINRAIASGLRYLWTTQDNRAGNFPAGTATSWSSNSSDRKSTRLNSSHT